MWTEKVIAITGASLGIGRGLAAELVQRGGRVAVGARQVERLSELATACHGQPGQMLALPLDVREEASVDTFFARTLERFGPVDVVVNCAGAYDGGPVCSLSKAAWDRVLETCLTGTFLCCRAAFRQMQPRGRGRILNLGSISAQRPREHAAPYSAAKFGVWGLTQALALEGRTAGISVSCLHPGNVLVERRQGSESEADAEPMMSVATIVRAAIAMLEVPEDVNFLEGIVLPVQQAYLGRG